MQIFLLNCLIVLCKTQHFGFWRVCPNDFLHNFLLRFFYLRRNSLFIAFKQKPQNRIFFKLRLVPENYRNFAVSGLCLYLFLHLIYHTFFKIVITKRGKLNRYFCLIPNVYPPALPLRKEPLSPLRKAFRRTFRLQIPTYFHFPTPMLTFKILSTSFIISLSNEPTYSLSRCRSTVRICSAKIVDFLGRPLAFISKCTGRSFLSAANLFVPKYF